MQHLIVDGNGRGLTWRRARRTLAVAALALGVFGLSACGTAQVARVNGEVIRHAEVQRDMRDLMDFYSAAQGVDWQGDPRAQDQLVYLRSQVVANVIDTRLIRQEARSQGISASEREIDERSAEIIEMAGGREQFLERMRERNMTALAFRRYVEDELLRERLAERHAPVSTDPVEARRVRHVLVDSQEAASAARERLAGGESWEAVAAEVSQDPGTRTRGGDLGFLTEGATIPAFDQAVFSLPVNELSQPVQTQVGYHIIQVTEITSQQPTPDQMQQRQDQAFAEYMDMVRDQADIDYSGVEPTSMPPPGTP